MPGTPIVKAAGVTDLEVRKLLHVGFTVVQVRFIAGATRSAATLRALSRHPEFTKAQRLQLIDGPRTMKSLLLAKFTRAQAKVLLEVLGA